MPASEQGTHPFLPARDWLAAAVTRLEKAGVDSPALSAQLVLAQSLSMSRERMYLDLGSLSLDDSLLIQAEHLLARREQGEPMAYIMGRREFYGLDMLVTPDVLIPRPESEHLVEEGVKILAARPGGTAPRFADLGTGSGALAVALAHEVPTAQGLALDRSRQALEVAAENVRRHGVGKRLVLAQGDFAAVPVPVESLDLVVSNPPYVSEKEYREVSHEVRDFEPKSALVPDVPGVSTGLECLVVVAREAHGLLRPGGWLLMEMGCTQGGDGLALLDRAGCWGKTGIIKDLAGLDRILFALK